MAGGYDAGVRWGESLARDMVAIPLSGPQRYVVTAALWRVRVARRRQARLRRALETLR